MRPALLGLAALVLGGCGKGDGSASGGREPVVVQPPELEPGVINTDVDAKLRSAIIDDVAREIEQHYVIPDVATRMVAAIREHRARGDYDKIGDATEFAARLTRDLREVSHDLHLDVEFAALAAPPPPPASAEAEAATFAKRMNYGFGPIERMSGNVARVVIDAFPEIVDDEAREAVGAKLSQVANADALIFDLRANHGGSPETVALIASYVFDRPTHLNDMYSRDTGKTEPSWTLGSVKGKRFGGKKPVFVLTSKLTFSGGEEFAYDLQAAKRATIIGETTGGGAHPVARHPIADGFEILVPFARPINPITGTDWEGAGVTPNIAVPAEQALAEAHARAVAKR